MKSLNQISVSQISDKQSIDGGILLSFIIFFCKEAFVLIYPHCHRQTLRQANFQPLLFYVISGWRRNRKRDWQHNRHEGNEGLSIAWRFETLWVWDGFGWSVACL